MADKSLRGHTSLLVAYVIFGLNTPIAKAVFLSESGVSAIALSFYRMAGGAVLFWIASLFTKKERVAGRDILLLFFASMFGILINQTSFIMGLSLTSPIDASVIATIGPILTMLLAALFLKEPITWKKALGVFVGAVGAILLILRSDLTSIRGGASVEGNLLCILSSLSFAFYLTLFKPVISRYNSVTVMKWMFLFAAVSSVPISWGHVAAVDYSQLSVDMWLRISFVVVMATFVAYLFIPTGQRLLRPTVVSMYNYLQPLVSSLVAVTLGMGIFGWEKGGAAILIFLGVYIVIQSKSRAQLESENRHQAE